MRWRSVIVATPLKRATCRWKAPAKSCRTIPTYRKSILACRQVPCARGSASGCLLRHPDHDGGPGQQAALPHGQEHNLHMAGTVSHTEIRNVRPVKNLAYHPGRIFRSEEHTSELQSRGHLV